MVNRPLAIVSSIFLYLLILGMIQCSNRSNKKPDAELKINNPNVPNQNFTPDTTVNSILRLSNPTSFNLFFHATDKFSLIDNERESPVLILSNESHSEQLLLYQFEGSTLNAFSKFEIVSAKEYQPSSRIIETNYQSFQTENGIRLNMSIGQVIEKKGSDYTKEIDSKIVYRLSDFDKSEFLKRYNMPAYSIELYFQEGNLYKFLYGFDYP